MDYLEFSLGTVGPGRMVQVELRGHEADVYLVDDENATRFKRDGTGNGLSKHFGRSPLTFAIPSRAEWKVLVVSNGGRVEADVSLV